MIVSWKWLAEYVDLDMAYDDLIDRLTMSGLNHEHTEPWGDDQAIDLEVTSNRADCLGHIGVAREIATLYDLPLKLPAANPAVAADSIANHCEVELASPETCGRYTARLIKGVKIGPSPQWMQQRLQAIGVGIVNNVVDATNYVMMECGQPLHAFDFSKLNGGKIVVRDAQAGEEFEAIDHRTYPLEPGMCVIADAAVPVALGGVMGGADSEVSDATTDVLIEAAYFDQLSVRTTARKLKLHSPSSFRFERNVDCANLDWASRRVCELILLTAGGKLLDGVIDVGQPPATPAPVTLRFAQLRRMLGIDIPVEFVPKTLEQLGLQIETSNEKSLTAIPPSWRKDLTREADLVEEVGRIFGFDKIPDDSKVPMAASHRPKSDRVIDKIRSVFTSAGFDEAVTPSLVPEPWSDAFSPWTDSPPLLSSQPMLGVLDEYSQNIGAVNLLRRSLVPSLLEVRRINEYRSNLDAELFETAKVYLPLGADEIPDQPTKLGLVSGRDYFAVKGVVETLIQSIHPSASLQIRECDHALLDKSKSAALVIDNQLLGWMGEVSKSGAKQFGLRASATVAELDFDVLAAMSVMIPHHTNQSAFPPVTRDFNFIVDNTVRWADLESTVRSAGGTLLESVEYRETFRNEDKDGPNKKRLLLSVVLRSSDSTLTGEQAEAICNAIVSDCQANHEASLLG